MKILALLSILCFTTALAWLTEQQPEALKKYGAECSKEIGITIKTILEALIGGAQENEGKVKCFAACILKKTGIMSDDGVLHEDVIREKVPKDVPKEQVDNVINKCIQIQGETDCEKAAEFVKCIVKVAAAEELS